MNKNLVIMIGNARGGEKAWQSAYVNLIKPHNADLAVCFGQTNYKESSLYAYSKYIWEIKEYYNWREYYEQYCTSRFWEKSLSLGVHNGLMGAIDGHHGSAPIQFAIKNFILRNYIDILLRYDTIIMTRSDHYYIYPDDANKDRDRIWIPEGEDWGGICDRHIEFNSKYVKEVLDILSFIDSENGYNILKQENKTNPEGVLDSIFRYRQLPTARYKRNQFCVALKTDKTRWYFPGSFSTFFDTELLVKYRDEYKASLQNYIQRL